MECQYKKSGEQFHVKQVIIKCIRSMHPTQITPKALYNSIMLSFDKGLKCIINTQKNKIMFHKINPTITSIIIHEGNIKLKPSFLQELEKVPMHLNGLNLMVQKKNISIKRYGRKFYQFTTTTTRNILCLQIFSCSCRN